MDRLAQPHPAPATSPLLATEASPPAISKLAAAANAGDVEKVRQLVEAGAKLNERHGRGLAPLHEAASKGHTEVVEVLVEAGADPNIRTTDYDQTPLHFAAEIGSEEVCKILLEAGAELYSRNKDGATAMDIAIQKGHAEIVKILADANVRQLSRRRSSSLSTLHQAASDNNAEIMEILLDNRKLWIEKHNNLFGGSGDGATQLDSKDHVNSNTALHIAAHNGFTEIARLLVRAGADATVQNGENKTPATLADEQGHRSLAQMLRQTSKLLEAVTANNLEEVRKLIVEEQNINVRHPRDGYTPLHEAARQGYPEVVQVLLDAGADLSLIDRNSDEHGATALYIAIEQGHVEIAKILRNAGESIPYRTRPFLESAVSNGDTEMVEFLTEYLVRDPGYGYINFNINDYHYSANIDDLRSGTSLLHIAATNGYTEIARLLVEAGAYVMAKNDDHKTPVDLAHEQGHESLAQMLENVLTLREAAVVGDVETVRQLLAANTPTNAKDGGGATVLYDVVEAYLVPDYLVPDYIPDHMEEDDYKPLHPVTEGHMEIIRLLIQAGARVDATTRWGSGHRSLTFSVSNPLHVAALAGQPEIVGLLIEAGKDINGYLNSRNHRNAHNALSLSLQLNPNQEVATLLIQAGIDVNAPHQVGIGFRDTPLHTVAAMHEKPAMSVHIAEALINAGANLNPQLGRPNTLAFGVGRTPLHTAASVNHMEMASLLLKHGANVKGTTKNHRFLTLPKLAGLREIALQLTFSW